MKLTLFFLRACVFAAVLVCMGACRSPSPFAPSAADPLANFAIDMPATAFELSNGLMVAVAVQADKTMESTTEIATLLCLTRAGEVDVSSWLR